MNFKYNTTGGVVVTEFYKGDKQNTDLFEYAVEKGVFSDEYGSLYSHLPFNDVKEVFLGLGDEELLSEDLYREIYFKLAKKLIAEKEYEFTLTLSANVEYIKAALEGLYHATYSFDKYKTDRKKLPELTINVNSNIAEVEFFEILAEVKDIMQSIFLSRDLVNERAEYLYPETLANIAKEKLSKVGVEVSIYDEKECEEMGLTAFLSVGRASERKPRFIVMKYLNNPESEEIYGFVGKGVTYDTGGYSLKPSASMETMNCDMGGAGTVIGAIHLIASRKVKTNVIAVVAACENMVSGSSYKPGDVIYSLSGKTIEVENTDAEGRITLADSIYYTTNKLKVTKVIDIATLTGACVVALGEIFTGSITNNQEFFDKFKLAADKAGERVWQMPVDDSYRRLNKSKVADVKNTGGRYGGMITAGLFIENFVYNNIPWIHLDIAGTAYLSKPEKYMVAGATGIHVKTLYNLVK
ncbi:leucyl aminopeptidase [Gemella sp. zg-570]|uniref:leucyl aminopeptidase n=1 Tax=Gemella sp. zg-570 TaxID=2840371 RepID=UPI001C0BE488|nr:leucyl aminopeptidase [Gemella sp. zg-570]QWQ38395.1 leucyl aminopeptidase [Gemella sp. zg-570]